MKALVLGASGMLGHKVYEAFKNRFETFATVRRPVAQVSRLPLFDDRSRLIGEADALETDKFRRIIERVQPDVIVNCVGVIKQLDEASDAVRLIALNALLPHQIAEAAKAAGARLIHVSTDCVFSGKKGLYTESDQPDPVDMYGQSKLLGEVADDDCLTLRTSIIGRDLLKQVGLLEWFLSQRGGTVKGYVNSIYSGLVTQVLAEVLVSVVVSHRDLRGLYQVASDPITKYDLLCQIRDAMDLDIEIEPFENELCDRSLDGRRFVAATGIHTPSWPEMILRMAGDPTPYDQWRRIVEAP